MALKVHSFWSYMLVFLLIQAAGSLRQDVDDCQRLVKEKKQLILNTFTSVVVDNKQLRKGDWQSIDGSIQDIIACDSLHRALESIEEILEIGIAVGAWDKYYEYCQLLDSILNQHEEFPNLRRYKMKNLANFKRYYWQKNDKDAVRQTQLAIVDALDGKKCIDEYEKVLLAEALRHLGNFALEEYNSEKALNYFTKVLSVAPNDVLSYKKLGDYYIYIYDTALAFKNYDAGIELGVQLFLTGDTNVSQSLVDLVIQASNKRLESGDVPGAERAAALLGQYTTSNAYNRLETIALRARLYAARAQYGLSNKYFKEYLERGSVLFGTYKSEIINTYLDIARNELKMGLPAEALENINRAMDLTTLTSGMGMNVDSLHLKSILFVPEAVRGLSMMANALYLMGEYEDSRSVNKQAIAIIQEIQSKITHTNDLSMTNMEFKAIYEQHLEILFHLHSKMTTDQQLAERVLTTFEQSKNSSLLNGFRNSKALSFSGIPSRLIAKETSLKQKIAADNEVLKSQFANTNDGTADSLIRVIDATQEEYQLLVNKFKENYPNYFSLRYQQSFASIRNVRSMLATPERAMIQYFLGQNNIYALLVADKKTQFYNLGKTDSLLPHIHTITTGMRAYQTATSAQAVNWDEQFATSAVRMFQKLIEPIEPNLGETDELVLIVDDELVNIPFDLLLTEKVDSNIIGRYASYPYLIRRYAMSYNLSSTLWYEMNQTNSSGKGEGWFGFVPDYQNNQTNDDMVALKSTGKEIKEVAEKQKGKVYAGAMANKHIFRKALATNAIVQFAGHCVFNDIEPDSSYLAFSTIGEKSSTWRLLTDEIYSMHVNVRYLVLSACETGSGKRQRGEGVISMARAFSYAGASAILSTLWKVEDLSAARIVSRIYDYLAEGDSKSLALQKSKLDYLKAASNAEAHPFNWAPFITIGNIQPIEMGFVVGRSVIPTEFLIGTILIAIATTFLVVRQRWK